MLNRILELLRSEGALTVDELRRETGASTEALHGMLDTLAQRSLIEWHSDSGSSATCGTSQPAPPVVVLTLPRAERRKK